LRSERAHVFDDVENVLEGHSDFGDDGFLSRLSEVSDKGFEEGIVVVFNEIIKLPHLFFTESDRTSCSCIKECSLLGDNLEEGDAGVSPSITK